MMNSINIVIPVHLTSSVIDAEASLFIKRHLSATDLIYDATDSRHLPHSIHDTIAVGLSKMLTTNNKIAFLTYLLSHYSTLLQKAEDGTLSKEPGMNNPDVIYKTKPLIERVIFEIVQHLEVAGFEIPSDSFTIGEGKEINLMLNQILDELEIVKGGNAVLGEQIEELQSDIKEIKASMVLGKKSFYQRLVGRMTTYVATKGADEAYSAIRPFVGKLTKGDFDEVARLLE